MPSIKYIHGVLVRSWLKLNEHKYQLGAKFKLPKPNALFLEIAIQEQDMGHDPTVFQLRKIQLEMERLDRDYQKVWLYCWPVAAVLIMIPHICDYLIDNTAALQVISDFLSLLLKGKQ